MPKITEASRQKMNQIEASGEISEAASWLYERLSKDIDDVRRQLQSEFDKKLSDITKDLVNAQKNHEKQNTKDLYEVVKASPKSDEFKQLKIQVSVLSNKINIL
jgi:archaellum component FlaC